MPDEIIKELWQIKDSIARQYGYDLKSLVAYLRSRKRPNNQAVVDKGAIEEVADRGLTTRCDSG